MKTTESRKINIQQAVRSKKLDALFVANINNIRYLTGFTGSSGFVLITKDKGFLFTDFRYKQQAAEEVKNWEIAIEKGSRIKTLGNIVKKLGIKKLGFESSISYEFYEMLKTLNLNLLSIKGIVEKFRQIKDEKEIINLKKAVEKAENSFLYVKPWIKVGARERDIALRLEAAIKKSGAKRIPFDIIVASGKNSSMPHLRPSEKKIEKGDFVIIDWGAEAEGYYSDMTRTFLMAGDGSEVKANIYNIVNTARNKAIDAIRTGVKTKDIDAAARNFIKAKGYGKFFGHGTGHGIGLNVHESPGITWTKSETIRDGMIFTIEPGIYIPELGGVRIEDMVLVKNGRGILLTTLSRDIEII